MRQEEDGDMDEEVWMREEEEREKKEEERQEEEREEGKVRYTGEP